MYYWYSYFLKHEGWTLLLFLSPINNKNYISRTQSIIWVVYSKLNFTKRPLRDKDSRYELTWLLASAKRQFATQRFWQDCKRCQIEHLIKKWTLELGLVYCSGRKSLTWAVSSAKLLPRTGCINRRTEHLSHFSIDKALLMILCTTLSSEVCSSKMSWTSSSNACFKENNFLNNYLG